MIQQLQDLSIKTRKIYGTDGKDYSDHTYDKTDRIDPRYPISSPYMVKFLSDYDESLFLDLLLVTCI